MQFHTEFQYDPAQDRRAGRTGQQRLELEARPLVALRAWYFFPSMLVMSAVYHGVLRRLSRSDLRAVGIDIDIDILDVFSTWY